MLEQACSWRTQPEIRVSALPHEIRGMLADKRDARNSFMSRATGVHCTQQHLSDHDSKRIHVHCSCVERRAVRQATRLKVHVILTAVCGCCGEDSANFDSAAGTKVCKMQLSAR